MLNIHSRQGDNFLAEKRKMIPADEAQVILLDKMLQEIKQLRADQDEIRQSVRQQVPEGMTDPIEPITVTHTLKRVMPTKPWFNVSIVDDGPNDVKVLVNSERSFEWHKVAKDETYRIDMGRAIIKDVLLQCEPQESASVRVVGTR